MAQTHTHWHPLGNNSQREKRKRGTSLKGQTTVVKVDLTTSLHTQLQ